MIKLPKTKRDPKKTEGLCTCRPVCKSRRREWKGEIQETSAELLLDRKPIPECFRRCPTKVFPNSLCPLQARSKRVIINERNAERKVRVVRVCQAPLDVDVDTPYLRFAAIAKKLGAWKVAERATCAFCVCGSCCPCDSREYAPRDAERAARRANMREFDARVRQDYQLMRIMYDL